MKKIVSILTGVLCAFTFSINAEEAATTTDADAANAIIVETPAAPTKEESPTSNSVETTAPGEQTVHQPVVQDSGSFLDPILKLLGIGSDTEKPVLKYDGVRFTAQNVTDNKALEDKIEEWWTKLLSTNSFGTKSPNIYVNISNTALTLEFIAKWSAEFKKANKTVIWNLSDNKNLDDNVIDALDLPSIYSLNLTGTSVTDAGLTKIAALLETNGIGKLVCITLSDTKVTDAGVTSLRAAMQKAVEVWKTKNPGKEFKLQGTDNSGVIFENTPTLPKREDAPSNPSESTGTPAGETVNQAPVVDSTTEVPANISTESTAEVDAAKALDAADAAIATASNQAQNLAN